MKKIKILALVMIFAFAALGGAYATLWQDTVTLNATVSTGNVSLKWAEPDVGDDYHGNSPTNLLDGEDSVAAVLANGDPNPNATDQPQAPGIRRDVGHIALDGDTPSSYLRNDDRDLYVTIDNAYPDYQGEIEAWIVNDGSVPVKIQSITATQSNGAPLPGWITWNVSEDTATTPEEKEAKGTIDILGKLLEASDSEGNVHDTTDPSLTPQGLSNKVKVRVSIHIGDTANMLANQDKTVVFKLKINGVQWNGVDSENNILDLPNEIVNRFD
ncbi:MAG: hypothetical protein VB084_08355 [Syntrophomonadaceae bacterium]|nr:hypothetical protein [Syntrophomonadaceae bacterium]